MKLRMFYLTPHNEENVESSPMFFRLSNPELIETTLPRNLSTSNPTALGKAIAGLVGAARALDVDIIVLSPSEGQREAIEKLITKEGFVVAYEDFAVLEDGSLHKMGYRLAHTVPKEPGTDRARAAYDDWLREVYSQVSENDISKVVDPWTTFLLGELRAHHQPQLH